MSDLDQQTRDNLEAIRRFYPAIMAGDVDTMRAFMAPDCVFYEPESLPYGGAYRGPDGFLGLMQVLGDYWETMDPQDFRVSGSGNLVTAHFRFIAVSKKTGLTLDTPLIEVWDMEGGRGKVGRVFYYDTVEARRVLGLD